MTLFDDLVAVIQPTLRSVAPFILTRLLLRAGVFDRDAMSVAELRRALPTLEGGLRESLGPADVAPVILAIREVAARWEAMSRPGAGTGTAG